MVTIGQRGAGEEQTFRSFRFASDGNLVDIEHFSITAPEWPDVAQRLRNRL